MRGEHEKQSRGGHGERRLLEEVEREQGEHGMTFRLLFGVLRIRKRQCGKKTHGKRTRQSARPTEMTKRPEGGKITHQ